MVLYHDLENLFTKTKSSTQINMFFPIAFLGFNRGYSSPLDETLLGRTFVAIHLFHISKRFFCCCSISFILLEGTSVFVYFVKSCVQDISKCILATVFIFGKLIGAES